MKIILYLDFVEQHEWPKGTMLRDGLRTYIKIVLSLQDMPSNVG